MAHGMRADFNHPPDPDGLHSPGAGGSVDEPATKIRRISKACTQCRSRKQKCGGLSPLNALLPCGRCASRGSECSFSTTGAEDEAGLGEAERTARQIDRLGKQVSEQDNRIGQLEKIIKLFQASTADGQLNPPRSTPVASSAKSTSADVHQMSQQNSQTAPPVSFRQEMLRNEAVRSENGMSSASGAVSRFQDALEVVNIGTPMHTIQHLQSNGKELAARNHIQDPVACGLITMDDAQNIFDDFFDNCHQWAPVLCPRTQRSASAVKQTCPALFTCICAIGLRHSDPQGRESRRRYAQVVALLDAFLSRLLLRPNATDVALDNIKALLLYVQWMPIDALDTPEKATRYNDISAWSVLGLAIRYALIMGLHRDAVLPFSAERDSAATVDDIARLRVWINILTCDAGLMLSSGLPASLNPEPVAAVARQFSLDPRASQPDDTRAAALCELVSILKRAVRSSGSANLRLLDEASLRQANNDFDVWERDWSKVLDGKIQHNQMPFTTLRAYRLAINSACLSSLLSAKRVSREVSLHGLHALDVSLKAASQTIFALSAQANWRSWHDEASQIPKLPGGPFAIDLVAVRKISYSVDSSWISHSFATIFLVLCYIRDAIDDDIRIVSLSGNRASVMFPNRPRPESLLYRLICLAAEIFGTMGSDSSSTHPMYENRAVLSNLFSVILGDPPVVGTHSEPITDFEGNLESLFSSMLENSELNWNLGWS